MNGMVARPASFSIAQLKSFPSRSQITQVQCEEGWSYIAEWIGVPLSHVLELVGVHPQAKYVVYFSIEPDWWDSIDMADALHPQTFLTYGMNGGELPVGNGGPLRMRVPRQLGYKSVKFITHLTVTDNLKKFGKGLGSASPEARLCLVRRHLTDSSQAGAGLTSKKHRVRMLYKTIYSHRVYISGHPLFVDTNFFNSNACYRHVGHTLCRCR